jgi:hypothetical protein
MTSIARNLPRMLVLLILIGCGGSPIFAPVNTLRIQRRDGTVVYTHDTVIPSAGVLLQDSLDFENVVLTDPSFGTAVSSVTYQSNSYRSEVDLYALGVRPIFVDTWNKNAFDTTLLNILRTGNIPKVFSLANPTMGNFDPSKLVPSQEDFPLDYFFPGASGAVTLDNVLLNNFGWCAKEVSARDLLGQIADRIIGVFSGLGARRASVDLHNFVDYDGSPIGGGFLLYISAEVDTIPGSSRVAFDISRRYRYGLDHGVLGLKLDGAQDDIDKFHCSGGGSDLLCVGRTLQGQVRNRVLEGLDGIAGDPTRPSLEQQFYQATLDQQSVRVVDPPTPEAPQCAVDSDCPDGGSIIRTAGGVAQGVESLAKVFSMSTTYHNTFLTNIQKYAQDPFNWRCVPDSDANPTKVCKLIARAESLNVFSNALQLVFLTEDSSGLSSGAAATALAYQDSTGATVASTCNAQHGVIDIGPWSGRSFFTHVGRTIP